MDRCEVYENCQNSNICENCSYYDYYYPKRTSILSPRQKRNREERKNAKRQKRNTDASKRGRASRGKGRRFEDSLVKMLGSWGFSCSKVPMSGVLKGVSLVGVPDDILSGDIRILIKDVYRKIEAKRRANFSTYYKHVENKPLHIQGFCYMMNALDFKIVISQGKIGETNETPDKKFKALHDFFEQDNVEIVAMKMNNQEPIFAITEKFMEELCQ